MFMNASKKNYQFITFDKFDGKLTKNENKNISINIPKLLNFLHNLWLN